MARASHGLRGLGREHPRRLCAARVCYPVGVNASRPPLVLKFADRFAVWSDVVRSATNVFVPTEEVWIVGESVKVSIEVPDVQVPLVLSGEVWGCRAAGGRFAPGIFVSFDELEISRCCLVLGLERTPQRLTGRRHPRVDCRLPAELQSPTLAAAEVISLSQTGLALSTAARVEVNSKVSIRVELPGGAAPLLSGLVMWSHKEPSCVGIHFGELDEETRLMLASSVKALRSDEHQLPQRPRIDVLIADDEPQILEFVSRVVHSMGCTVTVASRGDEALALARTLRPRLLLLDVLMPGIDGTELCQTLRGDTALAGLPIVLLSAMGNRLEQVADQAGATDCLAKPLSLLSIKNLVERYLPRPHV